MALAIACLIYGRHLFDLAVPAEWDVRAHIFKIDFLHHSLANGSWPGWITYWYHGFPMFQYYPPGFYFLGAVLTFVTQNAVISYKLLLFLALMSNGLAIYYFSRRFLKFSFISSVICLLAYQSSAPLLMNYLYGEGPNLLSWTVSVLFFTSYLCRATEGKTHKIRDMAYPGLLLGIAALIHPFPAIFAVLAVIVFHLSEFIRSRDKARARSQLRYLAVVSGIGVVLSITYWLPFLWTMSYASPIYTLTGNAWSGGGITYLEAFSALALVIGLVTRWRMKANAKLDLVIVYFVLAAALGFGLARWLPFGTFLHEFRFATIMAPFFGIMLIVFPLNVKLAEMGRNRLALAAAGAVLLIVVTSVLPFALTYEGAGMRRLFAYCQSYRTTAYAELLQSAQGGRLVIPDRKGYAVEGDAPVTFGWYYGVETANGPYNQGDPKFFKYTVHLEWEDRWLSWGSSRQNLMQEGGAKYIFIRSPNEPYSDMSGLKLIVNNSYGELWELEQDVARAVSVTPILLDVAHPQQASWFFNIMLPEGYKMVFVDAQEVKESLRGKFAYVMVDDESKLSAYQGKTIFMLNNSDGESTVVSGSLFTALNVPYLDYTDRFFYQGEDWDVASRMRFDGFLGDAEARFGTEVLDNLEKLGSEIKPILDDLSYFPVDYNQSEDQIEVHSAPGFTLIKDSYFPYWGIEQGQIISTTQGFMLTYSDDAEILLRYDEPSLNTAADIITLSSLASVVAVLVIGAVKARRDKARAEEIA